MKKLLICIIAITISTSLLAQDADNVERQTRNNSWAFKGKILPWTAMICSGINYTFGVEYGFNKMNAVGLDLVYNDYSFTHEVYDSSGKTYKPGPRMFTVSRGAFLYYRRYIDFNGTWLKNKIDQVLPSGSLTYISPFVRYGKADYHYQEEYITSQVSYDEWQYSSGLLVGVVTGLFDINAGPFYKQTYVKEVQMEQTKVVYSHTRPTVGFRVGVNLFLVVKKKGEHCLSKYADVQRAQL